MNNFKILPYLLVLLIVSPLSSYAGGERKYETIAIGSFFALALVALVVYYLRWKMSTATGDKFIYRQVEEIRNGRRVVVNKKFKVVQDKQNKKVKRRPGA
ncbi:hypothetical protein MYP_4372 [Sporocytophaga myxococcoides]|uniref:Uncharacterized protein n=1 Tax=Sporocytophaga myxococcoides TaxID=153721 RepID=A0A098LL56_9BACT|nr:hypothetical protein [Sporocytophaga myxococcoides]GAL87142.1 hypothetical protein MYP_4372 [Sporocytophaga myxococcoides]